MSDLTTEELQLRDIAEDHITTAVRDMAGSVDELADTYGLTEPQAVRLQTLIQTAGLFFNWSDPDD